MALTRRFAFASAACAGLATSSLVGCADADVAGRDYQGLERRILGNLAGLPGLQAINVYAPPAGSRPGFSMSLNAGRHLFVGSAIKAFILCERLRQIDTPTVEQTVIRHMLDLNEEFWSIDSPSFNAPYLSGKVSERTAMEAMILHSDNTATDMELHATDPASVRRFLAEYDLDNSAIPDSTRSFFGYLLGARDYRTFTWAELQSAGGPIVNSPLNPVQTLASSADDFVSFYRRSVAGEFFKASPTTDISATTKLSRHPVDRGRDQDRLSRRCDRLRQRRQHRRDRFPCAVHPRRDVFLRPVGLCLLHHQLV